MAIRLIARNDDFGSSRAANRAILEAAACGVVTRNVSCMATTPYIAEAAGELARYSHLDIGLHATLTSEWDGVRWGALTPDAGKYGLTEPDGTFFHSCQALLANGPVIEGILLEYEAQLDRLTSLGLKVTYADSHMFPEYFIPGLEEAYREWIEKKGLLDAENYYTVNDPLTPPTRDTEEEYLAGVESWLAKLPAGGQYFYLAHPAADTDETLLMYNAAIPKGAMRLERSMEHRAVTSNRWNEWCEKYEIQPIRYSEAEIGPRDVVRRILGKG